MKSIFHIFSIVILFSNLLLKAQTTNIDFESTSPGVYTASNSVSGWNLSSQNASTCPASSVWTPGSSEFSIIATPILSFPTIGTIANSPLGGSNVARLNNSTANTSATKLDRTFTVSPSNSLFQFAFAGVWEDGGHTAFLCEQSGFIVQIKDQTGNILSCFTQSLVPGPGGQTSGLTFSVTSSVYWSNWQVKYIDLSPFINTPITIEVIAKDCRYGDHYGTLFFDSKLINSYGPDIGSGTTITSINPQPPVNYCAGSNLATICAPLGYATYTWISASGAMPPSQGSLSCLTVTNPIANSLYTVVLTAASGCMFSSVYIISSTQVSITAVGSQSSCIGGSSGSASVVAAGSGAGYTYSWVNATNSVVSTFSTASNLSPGIYTVNVSAAGSASSTCGNASATVSIGTLPSSVISLLKPYCSNEAYLSVNGGSNFQWYNGTVGISSAQGGTASSYTVTAPTNGSIYRLSYLSSQGCQDSLQFTLIASSPGSLAVSYNPLACSGATNAIAVLSMTPANGAPSGTNSYSVFSIGSFTPAYSSSLSPTAANTFTATNLTAGVTYSVKAFDGSCKYSTSFSVTPYVLNYTLFPTATPTLCPGNSYAVGILFSSAPTPSQYSYSWSPTTFLAGGAGNLQSTIITPTAAPGSSSTIIYTVVVTPSVVNCPLTKTLTVTSINPATPTISPIPILCMNSPIYTISASPGGGTFSPITGLSFSGIIVPTIAAMGSVQNFTYFAPPQGTCASSTNGTFIVNFIPTIISSGNLSICNGQTSTLSLLGTSSTYTWSTGSNNSFIVVSPTVTTSYTVVGTGTNSCMSYPRVLTTTVIPIPTLSISGNSVCANSSGTLSATGANTYIWSNGAIGSSITVPPNAGTVYTVTGANSQTCVSSSTVQLSTVNLPTLSVSGNTQICEGQSTTLLANGASSYTWSNAATSPFTTLNPGSTSVYSVTGTDALTNCSSAASITVTVLPLPNLTISGDTLLCAGESSTLFASGANTYSWSTGSLSSTIVISPVTSNVYTLQGMNTAGSCSSAKTVAVHVSSCTGLFTNTRSNEGVNVFPNPTSGDLFFDLSQESCVRIINFSGKVIYTEMLSQGHKIINTQELETGIYLLEVRGKESLRAVKFVKTN